MAKFDRLVFVGTGDSLGVPRVYCECETCMEARYSGLNHRRRCSTFLRCRQGDVWLDCGPDWRGQMEELGLRTAHHVLLTHAHHDHIGGIPDLYDMSRWVQHTVKVMAPPPVLEEVSRRYPWVSHRLEFVPLDRTFSLFEYEVETCEVNHGRNGSSYAYRFNRQGYSWVYCPDSINLSQAERCPMRNLDLLVLGTAYYEERLPMSRRSLYDIVEALDLIADLKPGSVIFTHLSHDIDRRRDYSLPAHVTLAYDGLQAKLMGRAAS